MRSKAEEKLRAKGEIGDRFKDHGSMQVLEEVLGESKDICRQNDAHQVVRQLRLETVRVEELIQRLYFMRSVISVTLISVP